MILTSGQFTTLSWLTYLCGRQLYHDVQLPTRQPASKNATGLLDLLIKKKLVDACCYTTPDAVGSMQIVARNPKWREGLNSNTAASLNALDNWLTPLTTCINAKAVEELTDEWERGDESDFSDRLDAWSLFWNSTELLAKDRKALGNLLALIEATMHLLKPQLQRPRASAGEKARRRTALLKSTTKTSHWLKTLALGALWTPLAAFLGTDLAKMEAPFDQVLEVSLGVHFPQQPN